MTEQNSTVERALEALRSICSPAEVPAVERSVIAPDVCPGEAELASPVDEPEQWREPFVRWLDSTCVLSSRVASGLDVLHRLYCEWEMAHDGVPCTRGVFRAMLTELCFPIREVFGTELVEGLNLKDDLQAIMAEGVKDAV